MHEGYEPFSKSGWSGRGAARVPIPHLGEDTLEVLLKQYGDNIRGMEGALYQSLQQMKEIGDIELQGRNPSQSLRPPVAQQCECPGCGVREKA